MNWQTIKFIYREVLIHKWKIEYLGNDIYKIIRYDKSGKIRLTTEYKNDKRYGKNTMWDKNGNIYWKNTYVDGYIG